MELGEKLRLARIEANLTQSALCGDTITRNMLSQIEHGTARPSMATLKILAARLGKPMSYFLEEDALLSPNSQLMEQARALHDAKQPQAVLEILKDYREPDTVYDREKALLQCLARLDLAQDALAQQRCPYAAELLSQELPESLYCRELLDRRRSFLMAQLPQRHREAEQVLPSLDDELMLRASLAINRRDFPRAGALLEAMEETSSPRYCLLMGQVLVSRKDYAAAAKLLGHAEGDFPEQTAPLLELCYRELEDFKMAYHYACKQK